MVGIVLRSSIAIAISAAQLACMPVAVRLEEAIEVTGGSFEDRVHLARRIVTNSLYDEMRENARRQYPTLSDSDSKRLYMRVNEQRGGSGRVYIVVGLSRGVADGIDGERLLVTCRAFVEQRLVEALGEPAKR